MPQGLQIPYGIPKSLCAVNRRRRAAGSYKWLPISGPARSCSGAAHTNTIYKRVQRATSSCFMCAPCGAVRSRKKRTLFPHDRVRCAQPHSRRYLSPPCSALGRGVLCVVSFFLSSLSARPPMSSWATPALATSPVGSTPPPHLAPSATPQWRRDLSTTARARAPPARLRPRPWRPVRGRQPASFPASGGASAHPLVAS